MVVIKNDEMSLYSGDNVFEWFNIFMSSVPTDQRPIEEDGQNPSDEKGEVPLTTVPGGDARSTNEAPKTIMEIAAEISKAREN